MTCAYGLTAEQIGQALAIATSHLPIGGHLTSGGVEDGTTGESWPLPGPTGRTDEAPQGC
jgi:hypothetical protein